KGPMKACNHLYSGDIGRTPLRQQSTILLKHLRLIALLMSLTVIAGPELGLAAPYRFNIIAKTGQDGVMGIHNQVSINDSNRVAFIGQETSDYTYYTSIWAGDGNGEAPYEIDFGAASVN